MSDRTILCFGDSNTHGTQAMRFAGDKRRHPKAARWTSVMAGELGEHWDVIPEGHPGRTSVFDDPIEGNHKNGLRVLRAILESHRPIDLTVVMLGTNDLKARFGASASDVAQGVGRLVSEIVRSECGSDNQGPRVLLAAPVMVAETGVFRDTFLGAAPKAAILPSLLQDVAKQQGASFIDLNKYAVVDAVDGIHLDAEAHAAIGIAMAQAVREILQ